MFQFIENGSYKDLSAEERFFLYLPLEHHEDKEIQVTIY